MTTLYLTWGVQKCSISIATLQDATLTRECHLSPNTAMEENLEKNYWQLSLESFLKKVTCHMIVYSSKEVFQLKKWVETWSLAWGNLSVQSYLVFIIWATKSTHDYISCFHKTMLLVCFEPWDTNSHNMYLVMSCYEYSITCLKWYCWDQR